MPTGIYDRTKSKPRKKGYKISEQHRENLRVSHLGNPGYWLGKKRSEKTINKIKNSFYHRNHKGRNCPNWKGGITYNNGYAYIYQPSHPFCECKGYVKRSRLIMEKIIGRYLNPKEIVHHKGINFPLGSIKNKQDDSPRNLQLFENLSKHTKFHNSIS